MSKKQLTTYNKYDIILSVKSRCGGIGRRPGLKIPWEEIPVPVRPRSSAPEKATCQSKSLFQ